MMKCEICYEAESIELYSERNLGEKIKINGFTFERYSLMNNDLDCGYRVWYGKELIDVYQHYNKESVCFDVRFMDFKSYMQWLQKQVRNKKFLYI